MDRRALVALLVLVLLAGACYAPRGENLVEVNCERCIKGLAERVLTNSNLPGTLVYGWTYWYDQQCGCYPFNITVHHVDLVKTAWFIVEVYCLEHGCFVDTVRSASNATTLLEIITRTSLDCARTRQCTPLCFAPEVSPVGIGNYICYQNGRFIYSNVDTGRCAPRHSVTVDFFRWAVEHVHVDTSGFGLVTSIWESFANSIGYFGSAFVSAIRALGVFFIVFFKVLLEWFATAVAAVVFFVSIAWPIIVAIIAYLPYIILVLITAITVDAFQRAIRTRSLEPLLSLPRRYEAILVKPVLAMIDIAAKLFQGVYYGFDLAVRAIHGIVKVLRSVLSFVMGS